MKSLIKKGLLPIPALVILFIMVFIFTACQSSARQVPKSYPLPVRPLVDSSGNQTQPHYVSTAPIPAGTKVVLVCATRDCVSATDTSGNTGGPKILFQGTLNQDIPANTELILRLAPGNDNVK